MFVALLAIFIVGLQTVFSCKNIEIKLGSKTVALQQVSLSEQWSSDQPDNYFSGRPKYRSKDNVYVLFHDVNIQSGIGRWILSANAKDTATTTSADMEIIAYAQSWTITPNMVDLQSLSDNNIVAGWRYMGEEKGEEIVLTCLGEASALQNVLFFDSSAYLQPALSGFYVSHYLADDIGTSSGDVVFMQIREDTTRPAMYLFPLSSSSQQSQQTCPENQNSDTCTALPTTTTTWLMGEQPGQDAGLAYVSVTSILQGTVLEQLWEQTAQGNLQWHFVRPDSVEPGEDWDFDSVWLQDASALLLTPQSGSDIYTVLRAHRGMTTLPAGQSSLTLRNGMPIPAMGLGTGGIYREHTAEVLSDALSLGYRLLDLAREYGNEGITGQVLHRWRQQQNRIDRAEVFIQSKVWPTQLGFLATQRALTATLQELRSTYIDMYMLHWPRCDTSIEWMRCWDSEDPAGTWMQSYRALEKAYAEGRVMSIGVSNFNLSLLEQLRTEVATVLPHLVQNWAEPGRTDQAVRQWCSQHNTVYQPYAPLRNLSFLPPAMQQTLQEIAQRHNASVQTVVLQFFLQLGGVSVIPRSSSYQHLAANLQQTSWRLSGQEILLLVGES